MDYKYFFKTIRFNFSIMALITFTSGLSIAGYSGETGCIKGSCINGIGTKIFYDGRKYEGEWNNEKPNGYGKEYRFYYRTKSFRLTYDGRWFDGKRHGQGTSYDDHSNKVRYRGEWKNGEKDGFGINTDYNGKTQKGLWKDGFLVKEMQLEDKLYKLYVKTKPKNSTIKIMNIKPKFKQGIALKPGEYIIRVEHDGYETITKNIKINDKGENLYYELIPYLGNYYALIIGINDYQYFKPLKTAENDARATSKLLKKYFGFKVKLLTGRVSRARIIKELNDYRKKLQSKDNFLIYYAGHGQLDNKAEEGYWLPADAERGNIANWLSNSTIISEMKASSAKHILIVSDSCFAAKIIRSIGDDVSMDFLSAKNIQYYLKLASKKARVVLASGGIEPVLDEGGKNNHSVFADAFLSTLKSIEPYELIDGISIFSKVRQKVTFNAEQVPEYSSVKGSGHDGGDFVFIRRR